MKHRSWIVVTGFVWFAIGVSLIYKGLHFISVAAFQTESLCFKMQGVFGTTQQAATALIALGLILGFLKGRFIFTKTVQRVVTRIASLRLPIRISDVYSKSYWMLILSMVGIGISFRYLPISLDLRGLVDLAIGSALVNGSMLYFRAAKALRVSHL